MKAAPALKIRMLSAFAVLALLALAPAGCMLAPTVDITVSADSNRIRAAGDKTGRPLWKIPLGPALIEEMRMVSKDKLLVGLRKYDLGLSNMDLLLVDTVKRAVLWRFARKSRPGEYQILYATADIALFRVLHAGKTSLLALDVRTGTEAWFFEPDALADFVVADPRTVLAVHQLEGTATLTALDTATGSERWQRHYRAEGKLARPAVFAEGVFMLAGGLERFDAATGQTLWKRNDIRLDQESPSPSIDGDTLIVVDCQKRVRQLDSKTGKTLFAATPDKQVVFTHISPSGKRLYLLGIRRVEGRFLDKPYVVIALERAGGKTLWTYAGEAPVVSNLEEYAGMLYFGTATSLIALDARSGGRYFVKNVTQIDRPLPVRVRAFDKTVTYVGELVIAGLDRISGRTRYHYGLTPLSQEATLMGLDAAIERLEKKRARGKNKGAQFGISELYAVQSRQYQELSTRFYRRAQSGLSTDPQRDYLMSEMNSEWSRQASVQALQSSIEELGNALVQYLKELADAGTLSRLKLMQDSILSAYAMAEVGDYVYRPVEDASLACLKIVHLPSGRHKTVPLSAQYADYGIWNAVDMDGGIVYHHGLGLDPSGYVYEEPFFNFSMARVRMYGSYLIAQPIQMP